MRQVLKYSFVLLLSFLWMNECSSQNSSSLQSSYEMTTTSNPVTFEFQANKKGNYSISIYGPGGEEIARQLDGVSLEAGTSETVKFDTKFWSPGSYRLVIKSERADVGNKRFVILRNQ